MSEELEIKSFLEQLQGMFPFTGLSIRAAALAAVRPVLPIKKGKYVLEPGAELHFMPTHRMNPPDYFEFSFNWDSHSFPQEKAEGIQEYARIRTYHPYDQTQRDIFLFCHGHFVAQLPLEDLIEHRVVAYQPEGTHDTYNHVNRDFWWTTTILYEQKREK